MSDVMCSDFQWDTKDQKFMMSRTKTMMVNLVNQTNRVLDKTPNYRELLALNYSNPFNLISLRLFKWCGNELSFTRSIEYIVAAGDIKFCS